MNQNTKSTIFKSAGILGFFALLSRIVGLYRDRLFAGRFGAGDILDAYYAAFRIPDLVFNLLILGTLSVAFIPVFTEYYIKDKERANKIGNTILSVTFGAMALFCLILFFFVPEITKLTAPGFTGEKFKDTVMLTKIFLLSPVIFTVSTVFSSILNSLKRFALVSIAPIIYNFGIISGIVWFYPRYGLKGLAYGVILGALAHLVIQTFGAISAGFKITFSWDFKDPAVRKIGKLFFWRIFSLDSAQVSLLLASIVGSTLISGTISVFTLANNLQSVVIGMFGISFAIAAFPNLSEHFAKAEHPEFSRVLGRTMVHILFFTVPISVLFILLRAQIVRVLLGSGNFDWQATRLTSNALGIFAISIFAQSLAPLFSRAFYAMHNTLKPVLIGLCSLAVNAIFSVILGKRYGVLGLTAAFSIANIFNLILLGFALRPKLHNFDIKNVVVTLAKIVFSTVIMALVTYLALYLYGREIALNTVVKVFGQGVFAGTLGLTAFITSAALLGLDEVRIALDVLKGIVKKPFLR